MTLGSGHCNVALHFEGTKLASIVASRSHASAWRLHAENDDQLSVQRLQPLLLGEMPPAGQKAEFQ